MKRISGLLLVLISLFFLGACDKKGKENPKENGNGDELVLDQELKTAYKELLKGKKLYLTTAGQADLEIVANIIIGAGLEEASFTSKALLEASEVEKNSAVILVVGASGKGLGAAGTDVNREVGRAQAFGAKQTNGEITLVVVHVGGVGRTGAQSNPIIEAALPLAKIALVVDTKTENQVFTNAVGDSSVELMFFSKPTALVTPFKELLGIK